MELASTDTICFITPELGRWSTVGGLGVMVDELTQGLAKLGQDVMVISPYYDRNKYGDQGYLSKDPISINKIRNIEINLDGHYGFGVFYGEENYNSLNDMEKAINNLGEYKYLAGLFNKHLDLANLIKNDLKERKIANVIDIENSILSGIDSEGKKIGYKELLKQMKSLKNDLKKSEVKRLLSMLYFFNSEMDLDDIIDDINENYDANINKSERKLIKFFNKDNTQINADEYRLVDKEIINFRKNNKHNTKEDNENKNDKRYICYKEAKITTFIEMCSKNQIPNSLFEWVEEPSNLKKVGKKYKANFIEINNKQVDDDFDENRPNLILYNIGGLSHYEVSSIEKANNNKQFNYNIIIGSNKIYNAKEYFNEIEKFNEGKSGFNKDFRSKDKDDNTEIGTKDIKLQVNNSDDSEDLK